MSVIRSIVYGVVGPCKTESSQKPVPMHPTLADALTQNVVPTSGRRTGFLQASAIEAEDRTGARRSCANTYVLQLNESEFRSDSDGIRSVTIPRPGLLPSGWRPVAFKAEMTAQTAGGTRQPLGIVWRLYRLLRKPRSWSPGRYRLNLPSNDNVSNARMLVRPARSGLAGRSGIFSTGTAPWRRRKSMKCLSAAASPLRICT